MMKTTLVRAAVIVACLAAPAVAQITASSATSNEFYRLDFTAGSSTLIGSYALVDPTEFSIGALARAPDGTLYAISSSTATSRLYQVDETTGQVTPLHDIPTGPVAPAGGAIDPTTGLMYFLNTYGFSPFPQMYTLDVQTGQVSFIGNIGPFGDFFDGLAFDSMGQLYTINLTQQTLWRISTTDPLNNFTPIGTGLGPNVDLSQGGTITSDVPVGGLLGYEVKKGVMFPIDAGTGLAGTPSSSTSPPFVSLAGSVCPGQIISYGQGCNGGGGAPIPVLELLGCPVPGDAVTLRVTNGLGGALSLLVFGLTQGAVPMGAGCTLNVSPLQPVVLGLPLGGSGPGNGSLQLVGVIPTNVSNVTFTMQIFVADPSSAIGATNTNGIEVQIP